MAFMFFLLGGTLMAAGIGFYLFSLVSPDNKPSMERGRRRVTISSC
jgi:hypothetical protein